MPTATIIVIHMLQTVLLISRHESVRLRVFSKQGKLVKNYERIETTMLFNYVQIEFVTKVLAMSFM